MVFSGYPADPRPRRAAEALVKEGMTVEVICLKESENESMREAFNGVEITRVPLRRRRGGKLGYLWQYGAFILLSGGILAARALRRRYDIVHVHNMPDFLVFSALVPKMLGARVILDLHDPMPELMTAIFGIQEKSFSVRVLKTLERWSLGFADIVLTVSDTFKRVFAERSCREGKIVVVMNAPDEEIFQYRAAVLSHQVMHVAAKPFVVMYHGSLVERHGLDLAVKALGQIRETIPHAELRIYGRSTPFLDHVLASVQGTSVGEAVHYYGAKKLEDIVEAIDKCDIGIIPNKRSVFTELNTPTRIFEYLARGKPVIAPRTPGILDYFNEDELSLFELGNADDLAAKLEYAFRHPAEIARMIERGQEVYQAHMWTQERSRLVQVVCDLLKCRSSEIGQKESSLSKVYER